MTDPNGLHFAAGAFVGGMTGLLLTHAGHAQMDAALMGLYATCLIGSMKAVRDGRLHPPLQALKNGALIAVGGVITPVLLLLPI